MASAAPKIEARDYRAEAWAIVDDALPLDKPVVSAFTDPESYIERGVLKAERQRMFWWEYAHIRAEAEGGLPRIRMPKGTTVNEGTIMEAVSRDLVRTYPDEVAA